MGEVLAVAGVEPAAVTLYAFGGAGGLHAGAVAGLAGVGRVRSFAHGGVFSARGVLGSEVAEGTGALVAASDWSSVPAAASRHVCWSEQPQATALVGLAGLSDDEIVEGPAFDRRTGRRPCCPARMGLPTSRRPTASCGRDCDPAACRSLGARANRWTAPRSEASCFPPLFAAVTGRSGHGLVRRLATCPLVGGLFARPLRPARVGPMSLLDDIAIVGVAETPIGKLPGRSAISLQAEAAVAATRAAGLAKHDIDAVFSFSGYSQAMMLHAARVAEYLGLRPELAVVTDVGGPGTHHAALLNVAAAIDSGMCTTALCTYGENGISIRRSGRGRAPGTLTGGEDFEAPYGQIAMISGYALFAQRHMHLHGTTSEQLGAVAVASRHHASLNDNAHKREPITLADHQASPMISSPLRRLDCSLISDAGGAFVVTSLDRARVLGGSLRPGARLRSGCHPPHPVAGSRPARARRADGRGPGLRPVGAGGGRRRRGLHPRRLHLQRGGGGGGAGPVRRG